MSHVCGSVLYIVSDSAIANHKSLSYSVRFLLHAFIIITCMYMCMYMYVHTNMTVK